MSDSLVTPWTAARQAPLSVRFPRQEHWSGLPFPSPGDLPDSETESKSPALAGGFFTTEPPRKAPAFLPTQMTLGALGEVSPFWAAVF